ncbi:MAG: hypothetical protein DBX43_00130 [Coriobacteriia bacterium]|nr:MAG: hypothetical protein DBX43_00130 [Coriobacteriia bacterium]
MSDSNAASYDQVRDRLDEIVEAVSAPGISLDEALALYEEAVKLGLSACDLSEEGAEELLEQDAANLTTEQANQANQAEATDNQDSPAEGEAAVARQDEATPASRWHRFCDEGARGKEEFLHHGE